MGFVVGHGLHMPVIRTLLFETSKKLSRGKLRPSVFRRNEGKLARPRDCVIHFFYFCSSWAQEMRRAGGNQQVVTEEVLQEQRRKVLGL